MKEIKKKETATIHPYRLLTVAFTEGAVVMAAELLGAKMLAPFFGTTIYAWAAVLAVTLTGLATGYYSGGYFTRKHQAARILRIVLVAAGLLMMLMPVWSVWIMKALIHMDLIPGLLISLMLFVFPPVFFFGMVSPLIVHILVKNVEQTGSTAGKVYAISTVGGVINTLLLGFYLIPEFGIKGPSVFYGFLILLAVLLILPKKVKPITVILVTGAALVSVGAQAGRGKMDSERFSILYASEGMLGQVKVLDINGMALNGKPMEPRGLIVNNTWQTIQNKTDKENLLDYIYFIKPILSHYKGNKGDALLVGLGGGMLAGEMAKTGMKTEVVEIDGRLESLARRYFNLDPSLEVIIDDGRHFINQTRKKYSLVVLDAFLGENAPWHLLTRECFESIQNKLTPDGLLLIEFFGHIRGEKGLAARSVLKTLKECGFQVQLVGTRKGDAPDRNLIFVASKGAFPFTGLVYGENPYAEEPINDLNDFRVQVTEQELQDAEVLTDNFPALEKMLGKPALQWRRDLNAVLRDLLVEDDLPIFY
jgi:predicted membrane-bound spermidine synthase